jgi:predicted PurR-regulated permease PerM
MSDSNENEKPPIQSLHIWQFQAVRDVLLILSVWGLLTLGYYLGSVTVPILIALGLAYMFEPLIGKMQRLHAGLTRTRVVTMTMGVLMVAIVLFVTLVLPLVYTQTRDLVRNRGKHALTLQSFSRNESIPAPLREYIANAAQLLMETVDVPGEQNPHSDTGDGDGVAPVEPGVGAETPQLAKQPLSESDVRRIVADEMDRRRLGAEPEHDGLSTTLKRVLSWAGGFALGLLDFVMTVFLIGFFFFIFSTTYPSVMESLRGFVPVSRRERTFELASKMDQAVSGFVRGRITIVFILSAVFSIGWTICGVPYGFLLGLIVGLATIVPYLAGAGLVAAYGLLMLKLNGTPGDTMYHQMLADGTLELVWWRVALFPAIVFILAQLIDDYVLTPMIQGPATNLSTPAIVVAVIAGGSLAGLYGMLLAIPAAACLRILATDVFWPKFKMWVQGQRSDPLPLEQ